MLGILLAVHTGTISGACFPSFDMAKAPSKKRATKGRKTDNTGAVFFKLPSVPWLVAILRLENHLTRRHLNTHCNGTEVVVVAPQHPHQQSSPRRPAFQIPCPLWHTRTTEPERTRHWVNSRTGCSVGHCPAPGNVVDAAAQRLGETRANNVDREFGLEFDRVRRGNSLAGS